MRTLDERLASLSEHDREIVEAMTADLQEIERLRAENAKLRADALASEPIVKAQAGEIYRLRVQLAASESACAQMREALRMLDTYIATQGNSPIDGDKIHAALATDAGRGYVSTEGAVEAEVMPMPLSNGNAALAAVIPADWIGHTVLIIRKPEDE